MNRALLVGAAMSTLVFAAACTPKVETLGNTPRKEQLEKIKPGQTKDQVRQSLGSPSSVAMFDKNTWYYIGKREEQWAFLTPRVKKQSVLIVRFNGTGTVSEVKKLGLKDAKDVNYVKAETPTMGREDGLIRSMMRLLLDQRSLLGGGGGGGSPDDFR